MHKDLKNKYYLSWIKFLKSTEKWDTKEIEKYQLENLRRIIRLAYTKTKGYKRLFEQAGIKPEQLLNISDIEKFPFITKEEIRDNLEDFSVPSQDREYITTGGSTGIPFGFYRDKQSFAKELASKAYQYYRVGWREGDPQMVFRGLPIDNEKHMIYFPEFNELRCSSYYLTKKQMEIYRNEAWKYKPKYIKCYPSSGYLFAKYLKDNNKPFPKIKAVLCASENLYDFQKKLIHEVFGCRVFSHYGHYELATIAAFCEFEDTYHVLPYYGFAELIDKCGNRVTSPGEIGEIVATSFIMEKTPFIRYKTKDLAIYDGDYCKSCGRHYQIWKRIEGRSQEFIVTKNNRYISMTAINMHDDIFDNIKQFQFYQKKKGEVYFRYVPKKNIDTKEISAILDKLYKKFSKDVRLISQKVSIIEPTKRGKHRFLIQDLDIKFDN